MQMRSFSTNRAFMLQVFFLFFLTTKKPHHSCNKIADIKATPFIAKYRKPFWLCMKRMVCKLEQLERLPSEDTPAASWSPTLLSHVGSQVKTRSNDLGDIGQVQRSSHATHLLMLVMICIKYGKNPSRTIDATERTWFSRSRPNDLENIGQGQRSLHATHPLMLMMICAKYGKNTSRIVDFFFKVKAEKLKFCYKLNVRHTL